MLDTVISLPTSTFPPLALGFMGLGTGYLIYAPQELFGWPKRNADVDWGTGMWGIWLPGFFQFVAGLFIFAGLTLFGTFKAPPLYMAVQEGLNFDAMGFRLDKCYGSQRRLAIIRCFISRIGERARILSAGSSLLERIVPFLDQTIIYLVISYFLANVG